MKKSHISVATLVVMLAASSVLYGCGPSNATAAPNKQFSRMSMQVVTQAVKKSDIGGGIVFSGAITPSALTTLTSKVNGKVTSLLVNVGDHVTKGQALATIDTSSLQQSLQQSQSSEAVSQANLKKTQDDSLNTLMTAEKAAALADDQASKTNADQQASVASAKEAVDLAQAQITKAQKDQQNTLASAKQAVASAQTALDKARSDAATAVAVAQQSVDNAQAALQAAQTGSSNNLQQMELAVQQDQAAYDQAVSAYQQAVATQNSGSSSGTGSSSSTGSGSGFSSGTSLSSLQSAEQAAQFKLQQAQLSLQQAQSSPTSVASAQNALTVAEQQLTAAENSQSVQVAQQQYNAALTSLATAQQATNMDVLQKQLAQAQLSLTNAEAAAQNNSAITTDQVAQAQQSVNTASSKDALAISQASLQSAMTNVQVLQEQLQDGTMTSPVNGIVTSITAPVGQMASGGVLSVAATDPLLATVNVPEAEISKVKVGTAMDVNVTTLGKTYAGTIYAIHPTLDPTTKTYTVDIKVTDTNHELLPGMFAQATLKSSGHQGIMVPADSVVSESDGNFVYVVGSNKRAKKVQVQIGQVTSTEYEITSGLNVGDQLVIKGGDMLSDNVPVQVVTAAQFAKGLSSFGGGRNGQGGSGGGNGGGGYGGGGGGGGSFGGGSGGSRGGGGN